MDNPTTAALLTEIERFLRKTGMAPSAFGDKSVRDPSLVNNLRDGRELRHRTLLKVRSFMSDYSNGRQRQSA